MSVTMEANTLKIVTAAEKLFMRYGIKSVSMDDVTRELGISKKTLYQYIDKKETLVNLVMQCNGERDMATIAQSHSDSNDAIDEYLRNSRYFIREMRKVSPAALYDLKKYYPAIWQNQMANHIDYFMQSIEVNISRGIEEELYRPDLIAVVIARLYAQTVIAIADSSMFPAQNFTIDRIIHQHALYHLHGIVNQKGRERMQEYLAQEEL